MTAAALGKRFRSSFDQISPVITAHWNPAIDSVQERLRDNSYSQGHLFNEIFSSIVRARDQGSLENWDDEGARAVSPQAVDAAIQLATAFHSWWPMPEVSAERNGGIAFEWYRDSAHLAVLTTDGISLRWAAALGRGETTSGTVAFNKAIPALAVTTIQSVVA